MNCPRFSDRARVAALRALATSLVAAFVSAAHADCGPVIAAYAKADATQRFAMFDVDSLAQTPKGDAFMVVIGEVVYTQNIVKKGAFEFAIEGYKTGRYNSGSEARSLKGREEKGEVRCEPLGERKVGTEAVTGYQIRRNDKGGQPDPHAIHMWVNRATGLPLFHGMGSDDGGLRWVFGAGVMEPVQGKIGK